MRLGTLFFVCLVGCGSSGGKAMDMGPGAKACVTSDDCPRSPEWSCAMGMCRCVSSGPEVCDGRDNDCDGVIDDNLTVSSGNTLKLVADNLTVPQSRTDYAIDLNGDGRLDNQLASLVGVLKLNNVDAQAQITAGVKNGDQVLLFDEVSFDSTFTTDSCAGAHVYAGKMQAMPNFAGGGPFMIDTDKSAGEFRGVIKDSIFDSEAPATTTMPVSMRLSIAIFIGRSVDFPLIGAHLVLRKQNGKYDGQIHGAIRERDVNLVVVPAFTAELNRQIQAMPGSMQTMQQLMFFDTGGSPGEGCGTYCNNNDGTCAKPGDGYVDVCEVATNGVVAGVLAPDVQMFTEDGSTYQPSAANKRKDSLSMGVAFTAVPARF